MNWKAFGVIVALLAALILISSFGAGCSSSKKSSSDDDSADDDSGGGRECDTACYQAFLQAGIPCEDTLQSCIQGCAGDQACINNCESAHTTCTLTVAGALYTCSSKCNYCIKPFVTCAFTCQTQFPEGGPDLNACLESCQSTMVGCLQWDATCFNGCATTFEGCFNACASDQTCESACTKTWYQCQQGCLANQ